MIARRTIRFDLTPVHDQDLDTVDHVRARGLEKRPRGGPPPWMRLVDGGGDAS